MKSLDRLLEELDELCELCDVDCCDDDEPPRRQEPRLELSFDELVVSTLRVRTRLKPLQFSRGVTELVVTVEPEVELER